MSPRRFCALAALFAFFATCFFATAAQADVFTTSLAPAGTTQTLSPTISSDRSDYAPGDLVTLSGANWQPGELVHINVNDDAGATWNRDVDVTADSTGMIADSFNLPDWFVAHYAVTASDASGTTATTGFTDATVAITFPVNGTGYLATDWDTASSCSHTGAQVICGTTSGKISSNTDAGGAKLSIQNSVGQWWNGSAFVTSANEIRVAATWNATTGNNGAWSYSFPSANFPATTDTYHFTSRERAGW